MLKKIILSSMLLLSSQVYAENLDKIFDIELGSEVDQKSEKIIKNYEDKNTAAYTIDFKGFTKAIAVYTPTTKKIYNVAALKESDENCNTEAEIIAGILSKRFGEFTIGKDYPNTFYAIQKNNKSLFIGCTGLVNKEMLIILTDEQLNNINKKEMIEMEAVKEANNF